MNSTTEIETGRKGSWASDFILIPLMLMNAVSGAFVAPVAVVGIAARYQLSQVASGSVLTAELVLSALASIYVAKHLQQGDIRRMALWASLICALLQFVSGFNLPISVFVGARAIVGLSSGILYAVACYLASQHPNGVRIMSIGFIFSSLAYGVGLAMWPSAVEAHGLWPFYSSLAALALPTALMIYLHNKIAPAQGAPEEYTPIPRAPFVVLLAICALGNGGLQMLWTFSEGAAIAHKFNMADIELILSTSAIFNVVGALLASYLDWKFGVSLPLLFGLIIGVASGAVVGASSTTFPFGAGIYLYGISAFFVLPYMLSAGAAFDESGHAATLAGATVYMASALGPVIGGLVADFVSITAVGFVSAAAIFIAACLSLVLKRQIHA